MVLLELYTHNPPFAGMLPLQIVKVRQRTVTSGCCVELYCFERVVFCLVLKTTSLLFLFFVVCCFCFIFLLTLFVRLLTAVSFFLFLLLVLARILCSSSIAGTTRPRTDPRLHSFRKTSQQSVLVNKQEKRGNVLWCVFLTSQQIATFPRESSSKKWKFCFLNQFWQWNGPSKKLRQQPIQFEKRRYLCWIMLICNPTYRVIFCHFF
jgi:hypothetical protein